MSAVPAYSEPDEPDGLASARSSRAPCRAGPFRDAGLARPESQLGEAGDEAGDKVRAQCSCRVSATAPARSLHTLQPGDLIAVVHHLAASCLLRRHEKPPRCRPIEWRGPLPGLRP
jgi:hypothetical protein